MKFVKIITKNLLAVPIIGFISIFFLLTPVHASLIFGARDAAFLSGAGGATEGFSGTVRKIKAQSDGKLIVTGQFNQYNGTNTANVVRLSADGALDETFSQNFGTGTNATILDLVVLSNDKILIVGGFTTVNGIEKRHIALLNADGSLDTNFTAWNPVTDPQGSNGESVTLQADGKILVGFSGSGTGQQHAEVIRLNADGSQDTSWTIASTDHSSTRVNSITELSNHKLIISGWFQTYLGVARSGLVVLNTDGTLDQTTNPGQWFPEQSNCFVYNTRVQPDNKILIAGYFYSTYDSVTRYNIVRYNADWSIDTTFNTTFNNRDDITDLILQQDGKIIISGWFAKTHGGLPQNGIARLNADGSLDSTFNPDSGFSTTGYDEAPYTLYMQSSGKLVIGGAFTTYKGIGAKRILRLASGVTAPVVTINALDGDTTTYSTVAITGSLTDTFASLSGVTAQFDGTSGTWLTCFSADGAFNQQSEDFTCKSPVLSEGQHTVYVRATDAFSYMTQSEYTFTVHDSVAPNVVITPTLLPTYTSSTLNLTGVSNKSTFAGFTESILSQSQYTGTGTNKNWNTDDASWQYDFTDGFTFPLFGQRYSSMHVSSNGRLCFGSGSTLATGSLKDSTCGPFIAALWTDLGKSANTDKISVDQTTNQVKVLWKSDYVNALPINGIVGGGTAKNWRDDDVYWDYHLPFSFTFYGTSYTDISVGSNGSVCFGTTSGDCGTGGGFPKPISSSWNAPTIVAFGYDMVTNRDTVAGQDIYVTEESDRVIIRWLAESYGDRGSIVNFEVVLYTNGRIDTNYGNQTGSLYNPPTMGVSKGDGVHYTASAYNGQRDVNNATSKTYTYNGTNYVEANKTPDTQTINLSVEAVLNVDGTIVFNYGNAYDFTSYSGLSKPIVGVSKGDGKTYYAASLNGSNFVTTEAKSIQLVSTADNPIAAVVYKLDNLLTEHACTAQDGAFNSFLESFTCNVTGLTNGQHTLSIKASDSIGNFTLVTTSSFLVNLPTVTPIVRGTSVTTTPTPTPTITEEVIVTETPTPSLTVTPIQPSLFTMTIVDQEGKTLTEATVYVGDQQFVTDGQGRVFLPIQPTANTVIKINVKDKQYEGSVKGLQIVAQGYTASTVAPSMNVFAIVLAAIGIGFIVIIGRFIMKAGKS